MINKVFEKFKDSQYSFSINLSTQDMEYEPLKELIIEKVKEFSDISRVSFEVVESEDIKDSREAIEFIRTLKSLGCKILIDDFGSGYANFDYLFSLGADGVKIDGSLIKNVLDNENSQIIVTTIINFAQKANMQVIAEFVENEEIFEYLKKLGVECFQGYYFSAPKADI
jgi:EAL domain-containing protein (putative c-di-GMP-specific phosphodiesterase class I)